MQIDLSGEAALATGAGGGMGRAIAESLADSGADVVLNDVVEALPTTTGKIRRKELRKWE
jgi:NAD(P)-dependent dehydrogenase (short-subunit alcohol dehydrogenase family)